MSNWRTKQTLLWPWLAGVATLVAVGVVAALLVLSSPGATAPQQLDALSGQALEDLKLRAEIRKLEREEQPAARVLPVVGAVVAAGGLLATLLGLFLQRAKDMAARADELDKAREERRDDVERRMEERFAELAAALASDSAGERVSGLVGISMFTEVSPEYRERLFTLLRGVLTVDRFATSDRALARAFVALLRRRIEEDGLRCEGLDLQDVELRDVDLGAMILNEISGQGLKLPGARLHLTVLDGAQLRSADLTGCRGNASFAHADLTGARLDQALLRGCSLRDATLERARLDAAKLDGADCRDAAFDGAAVTSAHFKGAKLAGARRSGKPTSRRPSFAAPTSATARCAACSGPATSSAVPSTTRRGRGSCGSTKASTRSWTARREGRASQRTVDLRPRRTSDIEATRWPASRIGDARTPHRDAPAGNPADTSPLVEREV